jgi:hypothetical protein
LRWTIKTFLASFGPFVDRNRTTARQHDDELMTSAMGVCAARLTSRNLVDGKDAPDAEWNMPFILREHQSSAQVRCLR